MKQGKKMLQREHISKTGDSTVENENTNLLYKVKITISKMQGLHSNPCYLCRLHVNFPSLFPESLQ